MKAFWSLIALLVIATVVVFVVEPSARQASGIGHQASETPRGREPARTASNHEREGAGHSIELAQDAPEQPELPADNPLARRVRTDHEHRAQAEQADNPFAVIDSLFGLSAAPMGAVDEDIRARDEATKTAKVTQLPGGGIELDDRFTLRGKGSASDPFELTWDLLMSAREVYVPRDGREIIPGRVAMLNETTVRLTGYLMLPTVRDRVDEFVVMQNQWDGCCIGIPPTPYDSVEVNLTDAMDFGLTGRQYATITGRLVVDPYIFGGGMLIGLYTIEDASVEVTAW